jgi:hypothetical protein
MGVWQRGTAGIQKVKMDPVVSEAMGRVLGEGVALAAAEQGATAGLKRVDGAVRIKRAMPFQQYPEVKIRPETGAVWTKLPVCRAVDMPTTAYRAV